MRKKLYLPEIDGFKGILIALIVLGHNPWYAKYYPLAHALLYNFHVACFLLFPALTINDRTSPGRLKNRLVRLLVPQFIFFTLLAALYFVLYVEKQPEDMILWVSKLPIALVFMNEAMVNQVAGFRFLWFLPALVIMLGLLALYVFCNPIQRKIYFLIAMIIHFFGGVFDPSELAYFPWSSGLVLYLLLPTILIYHVNSWVRWSLYLDILVITLFCLLTAICYSNLLFYGMAGDIKILSPHNFPKIIFHDLVLITSFFGVLRLGYYFQHALFPLLGRYSLQIFLLHPLLWQGFWMMGGSGLSVNSEVGKALLVSLSFIITLGLTFVLARYLMSLKISQLLFPVLVAK